jgi:Flp pilus assembly protein TadG
MADEPHRAGPQPLRRGDEVGGATVEVAVALPAIALLLTAVLALGGAVVAHLRCAEGARAGARSAALGTDDGGVAQAVAAAAGSGAKVSVARGGGEVTVTVVLPVPLPGFIGGRVTTSTARSACEPDRGCG